MRSSSFHLLLPVNVVLLTERAKEVAGAEMADPTIQTFCCHRPNRSDSSVTVLMEFHSDLYNNVCVVSSLLGIVGAMYQVWLFFVTNA
jgi:hypothetical protein